MWHVPMSLLGHRHTLAYAAKIGQAVDTLAARQVPIWLIGSSQGSTAAVGGAAGWAARSPESS